MSDLDSLLDQSASNPSVLLRSAAHGASSVLKTSVLRRDRVDEGAYESRLSVCRACPGGHARFRKGRFVVDVWFDAEVDA